MHKNSYDTIIIGAGVIGLTQAVALVQQGFRIAIIDSQPKPPFIKPNEYDTRVFALNRFSQNCLEQWGIWPVLQSMRLTEYHQVNLTFDGETTELQFNDFDDAEPNLGYIVEQAIWRKAALENLLASDQCDFFWQEKLIAINYPEHNPSSIICGLLSEKSISGQLLIGADGASSQVRQLLGIPLEQFPCEQTALIFTIQVELPHHFTAAQYFSPQGIIAFLPLIDAYHFNIVWSIPQSKLWLNDLNDQALCTELNTICHRKWGAILPVSKRSCFPLIQQQAQEYQTKNAVLIGDAAHTIHPLAGQGANLGIADVKQLTQLLIQAKMKHRPLNDPCLLKRYQRKRRSAAWKMLLLMCGLQSLCSNSFLINQGIKLTTPWINACKPAKNWLSRFALYRFTK